MLEFKQYQIGERPQNLLIFLHGYNGNLDDHQYAVDWLKKHLQNTLLITPSAPQICDKNPEKRQWFGLKKYDPDNLRRNEQTPTEDIFAIYNAAAAEIDTCAQEINTFISEQQQKFSIDNARTFLCGFSQGAMLAIYAALIRPAPLGAAFALSGLVAGTNLLEQKICSRPPLYLFHGEQDLKVQYKTLPASIEWLKKHQIEPEVKTYSELAHQIIEDEICTIAAIINQPK